LSKLIQAGINGDGVPKVLNIPDAKRVLGDTLVRYGIFQCTVADGKLKVDFLVDDEGKKRETVLEIPHAGGEIDPDVAHGAVRQKFEGLASMNQAYFLIDAFGRIIEYGRVETDHMGENFECTPLPIKPPKRK